MQFNGRFLGLVLMLSASQCSAMRAGGIQSEALAAAAEIAAQPLAVNVAGRTAAPPQRLIVIGFMGGRVHAGNLVHPEAQLIRNLQQDHPLAVEASIYANRHGDAALQRVLQLLDKDGNGRITQQERNSARIVIFGHSWGASETVSLAGRLNQLGIPVLLTVQVDSVQKQNQNDAEIPPNVREAINFYQSDGLLHGRSRIVAEDPSKTIVLGNFRSKYGRNSVSIDDYPWYARAFMRQHVMIENDPAVWGKIEAMILERTGIPVP